MESTACVVGVDWSDQKHSYAVRGMDGREESGEFGSRPEEVHEWVRGMRGRYPLGDIMVALEQSRGALMYALSAYDFLQLVPINPRATSAYRDSLRLSGAKDDPVDAALIRDFAATHRGKLRVWRADDTNTRRLRLLVESRRSLVDQRTAFTQALIDALKQYFPQILDWFGDAGSRLACAFLSHWSTLEQARHARADTIRRVVRTHGRRSAAAVDELIENIRSAVALTNDAAIVQATALRVQALVRLVEETDRQVHCHDRAISELWDVHPDRKVFASFPGGGPVLAPRLAAAFGTDRTRFDEARELQSYSGIAPVKEESGNHCWIHARWHCPKFLRQTFHEFAAASIPHSSWARAFYHQQRERGAGQHQAIRALAFRWIRILFRCWKTNTPYDEQAYIDSLRRRGSPLVNRLAA